MDIVTLVSAEFSQHTYFIRKINIEPTMSANVMDEDFSRIDGSTFTTNYKYNSEEQEFIFCCKGKPFATLVTSNIPTPTFNLLDFDLIRDLGLKIRISSVENSIMPEINFVSWVKCRQQSSVLTRDPSVVSTSTSRDWLCLTSTGCSTHIVLPEPS